MNGQTLHDEWEGKVIARVIGELDAEERALVDKHVESCDLCSSNLKENELLLHRLQTLERDVTVPALSPTLVRLKQEIEQRRVPEKVHPARIENLASNELWGKLYPQLHTRARRLVRQLHVSSWQGQEEDVAWDIVQESMRRAYEYTQKTVIGERKSVGSLTVLLNTVAHNYSRDLRRREWRLAHVPANQLLAEVESTTTESISEVATESVYRERLLQTLAHEIANFPAKQRQALLSDLANRMAFGEKPSILQAAFQAEGIRLEDYRQHHSEGEQERSRNAALRALAYKRLKNLEEVQYYLTTDCLSTITVDVK